MPDTAKTRSRLASVRFDEASIGRGGPDQEHERAVAIYDLIEKNLFAVPGRDDGPYHLVISLHERKLLLDVRDAADKPVIAHLLSLSPFRGVIRDYFLVCESYYAAIRTQTPSQIEAIDMGRRGLHNEAAGLLLERLQDKIETDHDTARRLFTLIAALHWKG